MLDQQLLGGMYLLAKVVCTINTGSIYNLWLLTDSWLAGWLVLMSKLALFISRHFPVGVRIWCDNIVNISLFFSIGSGSLIVPACSS